MASFHLLDIIFGLMDLNLYKQTRGRRKEFRVKFQLAQRIAFIDGLGFGAFKEIVGGWRFEHFEVFVTHLPSDHHGPPADFVLWIHPTEIGIPEDFWNTRLRRIAAADFYLRRFLSKLGEQPAGCRGSGIGGLIDTDRPGQTVEERNACCFDGDAIELRLKVGLPSAGMIILGDQLAGVFNLLEETVGATFLPEKTALDALNTHLQTVERQEHLRAALRERQLIAFVGNGSVLPRAGGRSDKPLHAEHLRSFESPEHLALEFELPGLGIVKGLGIPQGVTVVTGGPYHGKSTLLSAIEEGIKNHIPGDGRELLVSDPCAIRTEAEEGRIIQQVDLSPFLHNLPSHVDLFQFNSEYASGSTSQAANIIEALNAGVRLLLIDEDRAATNLMFADEGMRELLKSDELTLTSYLERARELFDHAGVSSIIVAGSSSRYFSIADYVLKMEDYQCLDVTREARQIAEKWHPVIPTPPEPLRLSRRIPLEPEVDLYRKRRYVDCHTDLRGFVTLEGHELDLSRLPCVKQPGHLTAAALAAAHLMKESMDGTISVCEMLDALETELDQTGLLLLDPFRKHFLSRPTRFQICAAINRLRVLKFEHVE
ncbi:MAG: ABC-ATPase domain-containing protein [Planctomycetota bacterium]|nr:ABC-ATPase domain-containing protein [Planctomycetota bacterium]MDA1137795.1 ABC-ATPase domain-containing protein [Planctomycetota bacterium]